MHLQSENICWSLQRRLQPPDAAVIVDALRAEPEESKGTAELELGLGTGCIRNCCVTEKCTHFVTSRQM